ncbi:MAG: hypothetical protein SGJ11_17980 [Phycisphaerae bacterium]|nr:hypothetical protein [Phycisphaerae bacterium]
MNRLRRFAALRGPRGPREAAVVAVAAIALLTVGGLGYASGAGTFSKERASLISVRKQYLNALARASANAERRDDLDAELQRFADRTLGSDLDASDSGLRSRLNRIGEELKLTDLRVVTQSSTVRLSPAKAEFSRTGSQKKFRDEPDFIELPASIAGEGSPEQALRLLHRLDVEPWLKRIGSVRLDQLKDGERIKVTITLTTLFLPARKGKVELKPSESDVAAFTRYQPLAMINPFRVPPPPAAAPPTAVAATPPPVPPPPAGFPYEQWLLTGLVAGPDGTEAWFRNGTTGEKRQLAPGQQLGEATFTGSSGDRGEFSQGDQRFRVPIGSAMTARAPVS